MRLKLDRDFLKVTAKRFAVASSLFIATTVGSHLHWRNELPHAPLYREVSRTIENLDGEPGTSRVDWQIACREALGEDVLGVSMHLYGESYLQRILDHYSGKSEIRDSD